MNEEKRNLKETKKYLLKLKGEDLEKGIIDLLDSNSVDLEELFLGRSNLIDKIDIFEFQNIFLNISHLFPKKLSQDIYEKIFFNTFFEGNIFVKIQKIRYIKNIFIYLKIFEKI